MPVVAATDALIARSPQTAGAAVRAIVRTQQALKGNPQLALEVGRKLFPASEAELIVDLIKRDLPFYDPAISPEFVEAMTQFSRDVGILKRQPTYQEVVATQLQGLWES
jgi:ABC-type nitrate/sulfonate/bicarbonate transport system substrate-binding protein